MDKSPAPDRALAFSELRLSLAGPSPTAMSALDLATDQAGRVEGRVDVRVRESLAHRLDQLVHLTGRDALTVRPDDISSVDIAFECALGGRTRGLVSATAEERGDPACHPALPEVDMRGQCVAFGGLKAFVVQRVMDRVSADDAD